MQQKITEEQLLKDGFNIFKASVYSDVILENAETQNSSEEIDKKIMEKWKNLTEEEKASYSQEAPHERSLLNGDLERLNDVNVIKNNIIQVKQEISHINQEITQAMTQTNKLNLEIIEMSQNINHLNDQIKLFSKERNQILYNKLPQMKDELVQIEINSSNVWRRLQKASDAQVPNPKKPKQKFDPTKLMRYGTCTICLLLFLLL